VTDTQNIISESGSQINQLSEPTDSVAIENSGFFDCERVYDEVLSQYKDVIELDAQNLDITFDNCERVYDEVLSQYKDVIELDARNIEITFDNIGGYVNECIIMDRYSGWGVYYSFFDIDGNGVPELIISVSSMFGDNINYDIFTYGEGTIQNVFKDIYKDVYLGNPGFGFHFLFTLQLNGIIAVRGNVGTGWVINEFYKISSTGYAEFIEGVLLDYNAHATDGKITYRPYTSVNDNYYNNHEISEDEYDSIISKYVNSNDITLSDVMLDWIHLIVS